MREMPLAALHEARGAQMMDYAGWRIPGRYSEVEAEYGALHDGAGLIDLSYRGLFKVSGRDARSWLQGQVTQEIASLPAGRAAYATVMTAQGRLVCDMYVYALADGLLCDVPAGLDPPAPEYLDRFLIMERAEIEDLTHAWATLTLQGPRSREAMTALLGPEVLVMSFAAVQEFRWQETAILAARVSHCGEDGYDLMLPAECAAPLWADLCRNRSENAVHSVGWEAFNLRRTEAGVPWWGAELDPSVNPMEARLDHAVSLNKGCYVGQEIIARIHARGHVNNLLVGFFVEAGEDGALPREGAELYIDERKVGRLTTVLRSLRLGRPIALGYLRREFQEPGVEISALSDERRWRCRVAKLPFVPDASPILG